MTSRTTRRRVIWLLIFFSAALQLLASNSFAQSQPKAPAKPTPVESVEETWQVTHIGGQRVGYQYSRERVELRDKQKVVITVNDSHTTLKRFGQELKMSSSLRIEETASGDLLRFSYEMKNPPIQDTLTEGVVNGEQLELTSTLAGRTDKRRVAWEAETKSPAFPDRWLREHPLKPGESKSFKVYLPEFAKFSQEHFAADELRPVKLLDGKEVPLLRVKVSYSAIPEIKPRQYVDAAWRTKLTEIDMLGVVSRSYDVPRDVALQAIAGAELDLAVSTLIRIDPPIFDAHRKKKIVYRIAMKEESPEPFFVAGGTQQIKPLIEKDAKDHAIELTVTTKPIPPVGSRPVKTEDRYLSPTRFLQSRDQAVVDHADRAAAGELDPSRIATRMEKYVHEKLTKKNFSTAMASAAEVAQRMEGDCTEHAVLLAAMLRAKKVPSRIAAGLVYVDKLNAFGGHMWTEAFIAGDWIPLDATLGKGGIGPAHLKMADSPLDEDAPLPVSAFLPAYQAVGKLKIEVLKAE